MKKVLSNVYIFTILVLTLVVLLVYKQNNSLNEELRLTNKRLTLLAQHIYKKEGSSYAHFSLDDTIIIFKDLTKNKEKYKSIFDNKTLCYFKDLHDKYGLVLSCYCFYDFSGFKLSESTDRFKSEFMENADWLKFSFHGLESKSDYGSNTANIANDYNNVIAELNRITGCLENNARGLDTIPRIHCYKGTKENLLVLNNLKNGIKGILAPDDDRSCYYLNTSDTYKVKHSDYFIASATNLIFVSTDLRMENIDDPLKVIEELAMPPWNYRTNALIFFTHEWALNKQTKKNIEEFCKYISTHNYHWAFPQNKIIKQ